MLKKVGDLYALLFGWPMLAKLHKTLFYLSARALGLHNFSSSTLSGEGLAIGAGVGGLTNPVVFDIGANEGQWLAEVFRRSPAARIHAFEPQSRLADQISLRHPNVIVNNMALGESSGLFELCDYEEHTGSQHASLLRGVIDGIHGGRPRVTTVQVGTVDQYCGHKGVDHIDLLKIDVEGFELKVLQGATRMLREGRVATIQFEFNEMNVVGRTFLHDFFVLLEPTHQLFRLLPHGIMPLRANGHWINEQFLFQNIIAFKKTKAPS